MLVGRRRSYGADIQSIERNISGAREEPERYPQGVITAATQWCEIYLLSC